MPNTLSLIGIILKPARINEPGAIQCYISLFLILDMESDNPPSAGLLMRSLICSISTNNLTTPKIYYTQRHYSKINAFFIVMVQLRFIHFHFFGS